MTPEELFSKLEPYLGSSIRRLYAAWMTADRDEKAELEQHLRMLYLKHVTTDPVARPLLLSPPAEELAAGTLPLGWVLYNNKPRHPFGLRDEELAQHIAIFGRTGSGKTNTVRVLLRALLHRKIPFLIFDWKKDYSQLDFAHVFDGIGIRNDDICVLPVGKRNVNCLRINPLIPPPNTSPDIWAKQLCEVLTHAYLGGPGFESIFLRAIHHCYEERGIYSGGTSYPTFADVRDYIDATKYTGREAMWMQSVVRTIHSICFGGMADTVNAASPHDIAALLRSNVVLELDALGNADKTFLVEAMLLWLHHYRLGHPPESAVENVIVIEEAHHLLRAQERGEETLIESSLREMRSLGIGIVVVDQMPSLISRVSLANTYCTIALNVKTGQDVHALSQAMLLDVDTKDMLGLLPVGQAIVKLQGRHMQPFLVAVPYLETGGRRMLHYRPCEPSEGVPGIPEDSATAVPMSPAPVRAPAEVPGSSATVTSPETEDHELDTEPSAPRPEGLGTRAPSIGRPEDTLLLDIARFPTDCVTARYRRLALSARRGNHLKERLLKDALVTEVTFGGFHAWLRLFELTAQGVERLKALGHAPPSCREGGLEHRYWQHVLADRYRARLFSVTLEESLRGHAVDLVARRSDQVIAVEVETGKSDPIENVRRCIAAGLFSEIIVACTSLHVAERVRDKLPAELTKAVRIIDVRSLAEEPEDPGSSRTPLAAASLVSASMRTTTARQRFGGV